MYGNNRSTCRQKQTYDAVALNVSNDVLERIYSKRFIIIGFTKTICVYTVCFVSARIDNFVFNLKFSKISRVLIIITYKTASYQLGSIYDEFYRFYYYIVIVFDDEEYSTRDFI